MSVVIVCGGRDFTDFRVIVERIALLTDDTVVRHGNARGADRLAGAAAKAQGLVVDPVDAEWDKYGKAAGALRNRAMARKLPKAELCIAFPGDRGTRDMVAVAEMFHIPVEKVGW